jgi:hypothetical protein
MFMFRARRTPLVRVELDHADGMLQLIMISSTLRMAFSVLRADICLALCPFRNSILARLSNLRDCTQPHQARTCRTEKAILRVLLMVDTLSS